MQADLISQLKRRAYNMRVSSLEATTQAGSGHPTSCLSAADIVSALFFYAMQYDVSDPDNSGNDRFILSKGHAAPLLYAAWKELGVITQEELLQLRTFNSALEGHPTARFAYTEAATGSLGCGLSIGLGMALAALFQGEDTFAYVLLGDSEMTEGSVWEAAEIAAHYEVDNLVAIVDLNRLGQSTDTIDDHNVTIHADRWRAFGWHTIIIDGHDMQQIVAALDEVEDTVEKPSVIIARTLKGYGLTGIEDKEGFHGKAFSREELPSLLAGLKDRFSADAAIVVPEISLPKRVTERNRKSVAISLQQPTYKKGELVATRKAYGQTLVKLGVHEDVIVLDAEVKNSTFAELFEKEYPDRFLQCFIAEQNMIGMATGLALRGFIPFSSTFASFISRTCDQLRMASISRAPLRIAGSHAGVSIGQDGPSQMGLEDIAFMRTLPESVILYPADAVATAALVGEMANYEKGISYLRLTRAETPVIYDSSERFLIGGAKLLRSSDTDVVCLVSAGITLFEALRAYDLLATEGIFVSVIDLYSIKPLAKELLLVEAQKANNKLITIEDHYSQGGLGEAVGTALVGYPVIRELLAVKELSRSGKPQELLAYHQIDSQAIINAVKGLIKR